MKCKFEKIASILDEKYGENRRKVLMRGLDLVDDNDAVSSARWIKAFIEKLNNETDIDAKALFGECCPCQVGREAIERSKEILNSSSSVNEAIEKIQENHIIGRKIWYNDCKNTIYITKRYACDNGDGYSKSNSLIAMRCHCCLTYASEEYIPMDYCYCAAKFYYPLFEELFGSDIIIEPVETVLAGGKECTFSIKLLK